LDQRLLLTEQSPQADFGPPMSYQRAFVACDRAALATFKNDIGGESVLCGNCSMVITPTTVLSEIVLFRVLPAKVATETDQCID
jgi:hypothetical protein